jgi:hypothetical protein
MTLVGSLRVALPPAEAFRLFTATGEREWVEGWEPAFPDPAVAGTAVGTAVGTAADTAGDTAGDTAVGTVFETDSAGHHATWIVIDHDGDRRIRYARVVTGRDAGTVEVRLAPDGDGTEVTVTYQLTALTPAGARWLDAFAAGYPAFLRSWEEALAALPKRD